MGRAQHQGALYRSRVDERRQADRIALRGKEERIRFEPVSSAFGRSGLPVSREAAAWSSLSRHSFAGSGWPRNAAPGTAGRLNRFLRLRAPEIGIRPRPPLANQHAVAVAVEAVLRLDRVTIGAQNIFAAGK